MRATGTHQLLYSIDPKLEARAMIKFGEQVIETCNAAEIQKLIQGVYSEEAFPALANALKKFTDNGQGLLNDR
jgi:hypothetical protein